ncbi:hypothetical protein ACF0H5_018150 [Mactra antiquata]
MMMYGFITLVCSLWLIGGLANDVSTLPTKKKVCHYLGSNYTVGESITGDECNDCYCTQYGIMCQYRSCKPANCHDKIQGKCCMECPNGNNCRYNGVYGEVSVTKTGCLYGYQVCHCYHDNPYVEQEGSTFCFPPFPGALFVIPVCNATT